MKIFKTQFLLGFTHQYKKTRHSIINISYIETILISFKINIDFKSWSTMAP